MTDRAVKAKKTLMEIWQAINKIGSTMNWIKTKKLFIRNRGREYCHYETKEFGK